jgi:GxxExxY protein
MDAESFPDADIPLKEEGFRFMAAAFEVYNDLGHGLSEDIYQEALERELTTQKIPFSPQVPLQVLYKGAPLKKRLIPDLFVFKEIIIELKVVKKLLPEHEAQLLNYLRITKKPVGYLVNFSTPNNLEWKRMILTPTR